jgi:hypothetical protein
MLELRVTFVGCTRVMCPLLIVARDGCPRLYNFVASLEMEILESEMLHGMDGTWMWQCRYLTHHESAAHPESDSPIVVRGSGGYVLCICHDYYDGAMQCKR